MEWLSNIFSTIMQLFSSLGPMLSRLFGGQPAQAAQNTPPPAMTQITPANARTVNSPPLASTSPSPATQTPPATTTQPSIPLSYANKSDDTEWLDPADYQGRIKIPDSIKQEAGNKGVYAMITLKAGQHSDGHPYAMGFHVFEKDGKQTLIPFISGGDKKVDATDFKNSDMVESATNAPLPGLLTDASGKAGDGIHAKRTITRYDASPNTVVIDGKSRNFQFFLELEDGKENRSAIGVHNDFTNAGEDPSKPRGSRGCPCVRPEDVAKFQQELARLGIQSGSTYYILDPEETLKPMQGVTITANEPPLPTPPRSNTEPSRIATAGK